MFSALIKFISRISVSERRMSDAEMRDLKLVVKDGDCLVTRCDWEFSNVLEWVFTGAFYGHAAIYINGKIYEATTKGVRCISLEKFFFEKDYVGLCRLPGEDWTSSQLVDIESFLVRQINEPYDFSLSWNPTDKWYCSKLVYFAWRAGKPIGVDVIRVARTLGKTLITPHDLWSTLIKVKNF